MDNHRLSGFSSDECALDRGQPVYCQINSDGWVEWLHGTVWAVTGDLVAVEIDPDDTRKVRNADADRAVLHACQVMTEAEYERIS